jgi:predicted  nucleic acid-binding Zn-ribbon protein
MDFTQIFNGMVGKDFIKAFNDNFTITDKTFLEILATLVYKVKSTDIKEFKLIDNIVSYTLEEAPEDESEDDRTWTPVDITKWGNIQGKLSDQEDLWNILNDKAAVETVATLDNLLSTLNSDFSLVKSQVETNTSNIRNNTNDISDLLEAITEKVSSTNIKAIRLNSSVFQWSPDGKTWYEQPVVSSITWGHLTGDITTQEDLMAYFENINTNFTEVDSNITTLNNTIEELKTNLSSLNTALNTHIQDYEEYKNEVKDSLSNIDSKADEAVSTAKTTNEDLKSHLEDYDNPHHITKQSINLSSVDDTADVDKPVSTKQKEYISEQIEEVKKEIADKSGLVNASGVVSTIFVGNSDTYNNLGPKEGILAFVLDNSYITTTIRLNSENYQDFDLFADGNLVTPTEQTSSSKTYSEIPYDSTNYVVKVTIDSKTTSYDISISYNSENIINIDKLVEGDDE